MGFFDALRRVLSGEHRPPSVTPEDRRPSPDLDPGPPISDVITPGADVYDRVQWEKKLKRILDALPGSRADWPDLVTEARALGFEPEWVRRRQVEEFQLLVRRAVSDRHFTEAEHLKLDLARDLIGIPEPEAEALLLAIVAEAEAFFGKPVEES